jgi:hypothetical protein
VRVLWEVVGMAKVVGWFQIVVGSSIVGLWTMLLLTGVPEVAEGRVDIWFHIAAELTLASVLIAAGWSVLRSWPRAGLLSGIAFGALLYSVVNSSGYYAESAEWHYVGVFAVLLVVASGLLGGWWGLFRRRGDSPLARDPDREKVSVAGR